MEFELKVDEEQFDRLIEESKKWRKLVERLAEKTEEERQ